MVTQGYLQSLSLNARSFKLNGDASLGMNNKVAEKALNGSYLKLRPV